LRLGATEGNTRNREFEEKTHWSFKRPGRACPDCHDKVGNKEGKRGEASREENTPFVFCKDRNWGGKCSRVMCKAGARQRNLLGQVVGGWGVRKEKVDGT